MTPKCQPVPGAGPLRTVAGRARIGWDERMAPGAKLDARERVLAVIDSIPRGRVATYGGVAREAGFPRRARWVGRILRELPSGTSLAWHRVVGAPGKISLPEGSTGAALQRRRLKADGIEVSPTGRIDLNRYEWRP